MSMKIKGDEIISVSKVFKMEGDDDNEVELDEEGNPIVKPVVLDEEGNPIVTVEGEATEVVEAPATEANDSEEADDSEESTD